MQTYTVEQVVTLTRTIKVRADSPQNACFRHEENGEGEIISEEIMEIIATRYYDADGNNVTEQAEEYWEA